MEPLSPFLQPAVRNKPRYSVRPFFATIVVLTTLVVLTWALAGNDDEQAHRRTASGVLLARQEDEPEVPPHTIPKSSLVRWKRS